MEWGTPVQWGRFLLFSRSGGHKTKETYPTRPGSTGPKACCIFCSLLPQRTVSFKCHHIHVHSLEHVCRHNLWKDKKQIPRRASRGLNLKCKIYKVKRSIGTRCYDSYFSDPNNQVKGTQLAGTGAKTVVCGFREAGPTIAKRAKYCIWPPT